MKDQIKRDINACFIPREYIYKGTTKKEMFLRTLKKCLERAKYENTYIKQSR